jgi:hypothetical protein
VLEGGAGEAPVPPLVYEQPTEGRSSPVGYRVKIVSSFMLKNGTQIDDVTVIGEVEATTDPNSRADADGNRGAPETFVDEVVIKEMERSEGDPIELEWIDAKVQGRIELDLENAFWDQFVSGKQEEADYAREDDR